MIRPIVDDLQNSCDNSDYCKEEQIIAKCRNNVILINADWDGW